MNAGQHDSHDTLESLRREQIAFQGKILASATHEFQNHLAVIKAYNGLIRDLLGAGVRKPDRKTVKRCAEISLSLEERAIRAAGLTDTLNSFAHRGDRGPVSFRADEAVAEIVALMQREAAGLKVTLVSQADAPVQIVNDPSLFEYLVFTLAAHALESLEAGARLTLTVAGSPDGMRLSIIAAPTPETAAASPISPEMAVCLQQLGATVSVASDSNSTETVVIIAPRTGAGDTL